MTTSGTWRIDEDKNYKVHNYSNGGAWANIIQDGANDRFDYMAYSADGKLVDGETGMTEDEAMRRAQEAVDAYLEAAEHDDSEPIEMTDPDTLLDNELEKAAKLITEHGGFAVLPENAKGFDAKMGEYAKAEEACDEALRKVNKLMGAIEDMKYDCDGEVYEALLSIADILGR